MVGVITVLYCDKATAIYMTTYHLALYIAFVLGPLNHEKNNMTRAAFEADVGLLLTRKVSRTEIG